MHREIYEDAEDIEVGFPEATGGGYVAPFAIKYVNGVEALALVDNMFADAIISERMMAHGTIGADSDVNSGDVTFQSTQWYNSGDGRDVYTGSIPVSVGSALDVDFQSMLTGGAVQTPATLSMKINGTTVASLSIGNLDPTLIRMRGKLGGLPAGSIPVVVHFTNGSTGATSPLTFQSPQIFIDEKKKTPVTQLSGAVPSPSISYRDSYYLGGNGTQTAADIGSADPYRMVEVWVGWRSNQSSLPTVTIGGVTAPMIGGGRYNSIRGIGLSCHALRVPSGSTADIAVETRKPTCPFFL